MAAIENLVHQTSSTTGTGNLTLASANGKQSFNDAFGTGGTDAFYYFISNRGAAEWEVGTGHLSDATTLVRDTVIASTNSNAAVDFGAGTKDVTNAVPVSILDANQSKLDGIEAGADATDGDNVGSAIHSASAKTTPVDADAMPLIDSAASNALKKVTWANVKATLKTYFDTLYQPLASALTNLASVWTPASASGPASLQFAEDTDNGTHKVTLSAPASLAGDAAVVLPGVAGTLVNEAAAILQSLLTTRGDIIYRDASAAARLPKGTSGQVLTMGANDPAWATPAGGGWTFITEWNYSSGVTNIDFTSLSSYKHLKIVGYIGTGSDNVTIVLTVSTDNGSNFLSTSYVNYNGAAAASAITSSFDINSGTDWDTNEFIPLGIEMMNFNGADSQEIMFLSLIGNNQQPRVGQRATAAYNAFRITTSANVNAGKLHIFGMT